MARVVYLSEYRARRVEVDVSLDPLAYWFAWGSYLSGWWRP